MGAKRYSSVRLVPSTQVTVIPGSTTRSDITCLRVITAIPGAALDPGEVRAVFQDRAHRQHRGALDLPQQVGTRRGGCESRWGSEKAPVCQQHARRQGSHQTAGEFRPAGEPRPERSMDHCTGPALHQRRHPDLREPGSRTATIARSSGTRRRAVRFWRRSAGRSGCRGAGRSYGRGSRDLLSPCTRRWTSSTAWVPS